jgi:RHS repeat-associated protein
VGLAQVLAETTNGQSTFYVPGLAQYSATGWEYFGQDRLGSVRTLLNPAGELTLARNYDPFGNGLAQGGVGSSGFGYTGEQTDASGLVYLRARYYNPVVGRFLTPDTIIPSPTASQAWNRYLYTENNPINYVDPSGHCYGPAAFLRSIPGERMLCENLDLAITIYTHPEATLQQKQQAAGYITLWWVSHSAGVAGLAFWGYSFIPWGGSACTAACADGDCTNEIGTSYRIGQRGIDLVFKHLNDPTLQQEVKVYVNEAGKRANYFARFDGVTRTAIHEVKNVTNLTLSQGFREQAIRYKSIADSAGLELHYWLVNSAPENVVRWLEQQGIIVHIGPPT